MLPLLRRSLIFLGFLLCSTACFANGGSSTSSNSTAVDVKAANVLPSHTELFIPGPRRSFLRMAGISQEISTEETLPLLATEVRLRGYIKGRPTEYLVLLKRYLQQARRLAALAGDDGIIRVSSCADAEPLLNALGYRLRQACGPGTSVQTAEPELAFLTIDSGFPLAQLEEALRQNKPFAFPYASSPAPVLFTEKEWTASRAGAHRGNLVEALLDDPVLARLYSALARLDPDTALFLRRSPGLSRLIGVAGVLDFYGAHLCTRSGRVLVPGGAVAEPAWQELVGAPPASPEEFIARLLTKDQGWLAAYFDAFFYADARQQAYFTRPQRLRSFYEAFRGSASLPSATRPIFRPAAGLPLLITRLRIAGDGQAELPGNLDIWKAVFRQYSSKNAHWTHRIQNWNSPDQLVEGLFAWSREYAPEGPLQCFLTVSEVDRPRNQPERLSPESVRLLASNFPRYGDQYPLFAEFPVLNDASIAKFFATAEKLDHISAPAVRANATGIFQALAGLWAILARQGEIPDARLNNSFQAMMASFDNASSPVQVFEAGQKAFAELVRAAGGKSAGQNEIIDLLAGPPQKSPRALEVHKEIAERIHSVLQAQRLASIDTLFALGDGLNEMAEGKRASMDSLLSLAGELREFEMPRPIFTAAERIEFTQQRSDTQHTTLQARTNFTRIIKSGTLRELAEARGRLAAFLRDTLVGLNYAYYEPPGAQMLHGNAIFVRSHDYSEDPARAAQPWKSPQLINLGVTASGGAHLSGSLSGLPYALALVEQDFIVPEAVQSLIWQDFVPTLLSSAVISRWWNVTPQEMHAVALYQRAGEELLFAAAGDDELRARVLALLSDRLLPERLGRMEMALRTNHAREAIEMATPGDTFFLAFEFRSRFPADTSHWGDSGKELEKLVQSYPVETGWERLSQDFGGPHPALAHSSGRELENVKLFPVYLHYSSRLMAESWDSNNLYWARLADELGYEPAALNRLIPELTRRMVEKLFATDLEDWPAVLRATRETGEEFRAAKAASARRSSPGGN